MTRHRGAAGAALITITLLLAACGRSATVVNASSSHPASAASALALSATTPPAKGSLGTITWALYREVQSLDPIMAFDYPENTVIAAMCDSLLRQQPDGSITSGLASASHPTPTTLVLALNPSATFWDGKPVTPADVVFSLERSLNPKLGGFYGAVFARVKSVAATGPEQVTIKLSQPDYWLDGELSQMAGVVLEKAYVLAQGQKFGTPQGGTMCSGAFRLKSWSPGTSLAIEANPSYWDVADRAKTKEIDFVGVGDDASLTSGLLTGAINGTYQYVYQTLGQLQGSNAVKLSFGPSLATDVFVISNLKGVLGNAKVRQALSMAIDRRAYIAAYYKGYAALPRTLAAPGTWGYGRSVFESDWSKLPEPTYNVAGAKALVQQAGATGKALTIGMTPQIGVINTMATAIRSAAESIGLKPVFKAVSPQNFIAFFSDPRARAGVDGFPSSNYPDYADPADWYYTFVLPGGNQNFDGYNNPQVTQLLLRARQTADPNARAALVAQAGDILTTDLPWIPLAAPDAMLVTSSKVTGAPSSFMYMGGPWANGIGAAN